MRKLASLFWLCLLSVAAIAVGDKKLTLSPPGAWVTAVSPRIDAKVNTSEISNGYVTILSDQQDDLNTESRYRHFTLRILNETGVQNASDVEVVYHPQYQKLLLHYVRVIRDGAVIEKLVKPSQVKVLQRENQRERHIYDNSLSAIFTVDDVRSGDHIDYAYTIVGRNPAFEGKYCGYFYLQFSEPTDQIFIRLLKPENRTLTFKNENTDLKPRKSKTAAGTEYVWQAMQVPGVASEDQAPEWHDPYKGFWVSEFSSWAEVGEVANRLFSVPRQVTPAMAALVKKIAKEKETDEERATALLRFVQDDVRYLGMEVGVNSYKPYPPAKVFEQRFGDCKDKSLLLSTLLQEIGIKAEPALVRTKFGKTINSWLPGLQTFDHCVVRVQLNGKHYWVDPTINYQRGGIVNTYFPKYEMALVVGDSKHGLTEIPFTGTASITVLEMFSVDTVGKVAKLHVKTTYKGVEADNMRSQFANTSVRDASKSYLDFYSRIYPGTEQVEPIALSDNEEDNIFIITEAYTLPEFWTVPDSAKPDHFSAEVYPYIISSRAKASVSGKRKFPLAIEYPLDITHQIRVTFPEDWPMDPVENSSSGPGFTFTSSAKASGNVVDLDYRYTTTADFVEAKQVADLLNKQKKLFDNIGYTFTYGGPGDAGSGNKNYYLLVFAFLVLGIGGAVAYRTYYHFDPYPEVNPDQRPWPIAGWLILPAIGIVLSPFLTLNTIINTGYFNLDAWNVITDSTQPTYQPSYATIFVLELAGNVLIFSYSVLLVILFFQKRSSFPKLYIIFLVSHFAYLLADYIAANALKIDQTGTGPEAELFKNFIGAVIWGFYFTNSERVKKTFIIMLNPPALEEVEETPTAEFVPALETFVVPEIVIPAAELVPAKTDNALEKEEA